MRYEVGLIGFEAADSFELFTGVEPEHERMLQHFGQPVGAAVS
jgi:hypothetical protein